MRAIYEIRVGMEGPARARHAVTGELPGLVAPDTLDELELMVSELVTNAMLYGETEESDTITLRLRVNHLVRCEVVDHGLGFTVPDDLEATRGRGLELVDRLAERWGVWHSTEGTHVWFESTTG